MIVGNAGDDTLFDTITRDDIAAGIELTQYILDQGTAASPSPPAPGLIHKHVFEEAESPRKQIMPRRNVWRGPWS